jgi:peptidoglycan hydrolase-like protein with peptidoglycan-binding domain
MIRRAAFITYVGLALAFATSGCDDAERERRAREAAEQMKESIPDVHAHALEQAATPEDIELAQRALTAEKEYMGPIDGKLDRVTVNAIQAFQRRHDLADNGILAGRTLELLRAAVD